MDAARRFIFPFCNIIRLRKASLRGRRAIPFLFFPSRNCTAPPMASPRQRELTYSAFSQHSLACSAYCSLPSFSHFRFCPAHVHRPKKYIFAKGKSFGVFSPRRRTAAITHFLLLYSTLLRRSLLCSVRPFGSTLSSPLKCDDSYLLPCRRKSARRRNRYFRLQVRYIQTKRLCPSLPSMRLFEQIPCEETVSALFLSTSYRHERELNPCTKASPKHTELCAVRFGFFHIPLHLRKVVLYISVNYLRRGKCDLSYLFSVIYKFRHAAGDNLPCENGVDYRMARGTFSKAGLPSYYFQYGAVEVHRYAPVGSAEVRLSFHKRQDVVPKRFPTRCCPFP